MARTLAAQRAISLLTAGTLLLHAGVGCCAHHDHSATVEAAITRGGAAVEHADRLTPVEPDNSKWLAFAAKAKNNLAEFLLLTGSSAEAVQQNEAGCSIAERLLAKDRNVPDWRATLRECWIIRAQIALAEGRQADAVRSTERAVAVANADA